MSKNKILQVFAVVLLFIGLFRLNVIDERFGLQETAQKCYDQLLR